MVHLLTCNYHIHTPSQTFRLTFSSVLITYMPKHFCISVTISPVSITCQQQILLGVHLLTCYHHRHALVQILGFTFSPLSSLTCPWPNLGVHLLTCYHHIHALGQILGFTFSPLSSHTCPWPNFGVHLLTCYHHVHAPGQIVGFTFSPAIISHIHV